MMINPMKVFLCMPAKNMTLRESEELAKLQKLSDLIWYLNESDCAFFTKGWENDTDCQIINTICLNYGIRRYYHNEEDYPYGQ